AVRGSGGCGSDRRGLARGVAPRRYLPSRPRHFRTNSVLRRFLAPLHPDGFKFVLAGAAATILLFLLWGRGGWIAVALTMWLAYFFRDPWRVTPPRPGLLVGPADGTLMSIATAALPPEVASAWRP